MAVVSAPVAECALHAMPAMRTGLSEAEMTRWLGWCERLATCGWRSAESAEAFIRVSPLLLQRLSAAQLWQWAEHGEALARTSAGAAASFFRAARPFVQWAPGNALQQWVADGQWYLQQHPTFAALAETYFEISPVVYGQYPFADAQVWGQLGHDFARLGWQSARDFLSLSRRLAEQAPEVNLAPAWQQARRMLPQAGKLALEYLGHSPDYVQRFGDAGAAVLRGIVDELLAPQATDAEVFLHQVGNTLILLPAAECLQALTWCREISAVSHAGGLAFLNHLSTLRERLPDSRLHDWINAGIDGVKRHAPAGAAYFALESATALDNLQALQKRVEFTAVEPVLRLYAHAVLGRRMDLQTADALPQDVSRGHAGLPTSDGAAIYLPPRVDDFDSAAHNFGVYKVAILHQAGFYEGGTFAFDLDECRRRLPALPAAPDDGTELSSFQGFFDSFAEPNLARSLFAIFEDTRVDAWIARHYKGIRADLSRLMQHSRRQRPPLHGIPLRQALLEGLLQLSLGADPACFDPPSARLLLQRLAPLVQSLHVAAATVYDTTAAVLQAYRLLTQIPDDAGLTFKLSAADLLSALDLSLTDDADMLALADLFRAAGDAADRAALPGSDAPATGVEAVPYRGAVKPDVIEKKMRLSELEDALRRHDGLSPLSPEALKALLENDGLDIKSLQRGEVNATTGLFVSNLQGRPAEDAAVRRETLREQADLLRAELRETEAEPVRLPQTFHYDEWDYLIGDYRRAWCRLREMPLGDAGPDFVIDTRRAYAGLLAQVKRQFQLLKPEQFKTVKPLTDGEAIDLDSAVEALVDRRAGHALADKVYARRDKQDRSVAAVFLLDMSASTDDKIKNPDGRAADDSEPQRRIIDVEKEALVLMAEALDALGDAYAVYGFSGYGRDQVDAFMVKSFDEPYDRRIQGRIAAIEPHRSTRMGPVIRHAAAQLGRQEARLKALILLSDGYPQDFDYGQDRKSKEYGLQDTTKALQEARLKAIHTFCITVDPSGHDYLRQMCPDRQYLVIDDMAELPQELPKVYRGLTA